MPIVRRFAEFIHDLQQLERTAIHGDAILETFTRHTPFEGGAVYLRDREAHLRRVPKSHQFVPPKILGRAPPASRIPARACVTAPRLTLPARVVALAST